MNKVPISIIIIAPFNIRCVFINIKKTFNIALREILYMYCPRLI